jgi:hypothetical protein
MGGASTCSQSYLKDEHANAPRFLVAVALLPSEMRKNLDWVFGVKNLGPELARFTLATGATDAPPLVLLGCSTWTETLRWS